MVPVPIVLAVNDAAVDEKMILIGLPIGLPVEPQIGAINRRGETWQMTLTVVRLPPGAWRWGESCSDPWLGSRWIRAAEANKHQRDSKRQLDSNEGTLRCQ